MSPLLIDVVEGRKIHFIIYIILLRIFTFTCHGKNGGANSIILPETPANFSGGDWVWWVVEGGGTNTCDY